MIHDKPGLGLNIGKNPQQSLSRMICVETCIGNKIIFVLLDLSAAFHTVSFWTAHKNGKIEGAISW